MFWKLYNTIYAVLHKKQSGVLRDKEDKRDLFFGSLLPYTPRHEFIDWGSDDVGKQWRFRQSPFNICVFASAVMAASMQNGVRFSIRWFVKLAKKEGMISGNGFSYLRAAKKLANKYGYLPYSYMSDEIGQMSWHEYSRWTQEDEKLLSIASKFKTEEYRRVRTTSDAYELIEQGFCLSTANKWYANNMNHPQAPQYTLFARGGYIGGHAFMISGHKNNQFIVTNSFGRTWGKDGQAYDNGLFESGDYAVWMESLLDEKELAAHVVKEFDTKIIKGSKPTLYLIEEGKRKAFTNEESYKLWKAKHARDPKINYIRDFVLNKIPDGEMI